MAVGRLLLLAAVLGSSLLHAGFRQIQELRLKKDEVEKIMVVREASEHLLTWRWTLYQNGGLVVHRSYDGFNAQHVLKLNHVNQSVRIDIDTRGKRPKAFSYVVIKFKSFDFATGEALFDLMLSDEAERVRLDFLNAGAQ